MVPYRPKSPEELEAVYRLMTESRDLDDITDEDNQMLIRPEKQDFGVFHWLIIRAAQQAGVVYDGHSVTTLEEVIGSLEGVGFIPDGDREAWINPDPDWYNKLKKRIV